MPNNQLGELRRSSIISLFGPGSIVDFRADGAPVSAIISGLEAWDNTAPPRGTRNPQSIHEPRLEKKLIVSGFRLPPVQISVSRNNPIQGRLVAYRFPDWLQCPMCGVIAPSKKWKSDPGKTYRYCATCTSRMPGRKKVFAVPVRFIFACEKGHLDEFPWHYWVEHKTGCANTSGKLLLKSEKPGLSGLFLSCPICSSKRSMDGIFSASTWERFHCKGRRPWLDCENEECTRKPRVLQRGASNVYFPFIESALSIPPWSDRLQHYLGVYWSPLINTAEEDRSSFIRMLARGPLQAILTELRMTPDELAREIQLRVEAISCSEDTQNSIRKEEYFQLDSGINTEPDNSEEFEIRNETIPESLAPFLSRIVRVVRLREVRVLKGFTRINPPEGQSTNFAKLSQNRLDWLPAVDVRGEGIFLAINKTQLISWKQNESVKKRILRIQEEYDAECHNNSENRSHELSITPEFILVHTVAHVLMRQLTMECGYSSAALRERLYVDEEGMAGLLIYTATPDTDGTLGGLQRQGKSERIERVIRGSIEAVQWCSSDPLCIEGIMAGPGSCSNAACHACVLVPETSCEYFNRFLDRALLVGLPDDLAVGFFSTLRGIGVE